jgi:hypothetical protein
VLANTQVTPPAAAAQLDQGASNNRSTSQTQQQIVASDVLSAVANSMQGPAQGMDPVAVVDLAARAFRVLADFGSEMHSTQPWAQHLRERSAMVRLLRMLPSAVIDAGQVCLGCWHGQLHTPQSEPESVPADAHAVHPAAVCVSCRSTKHLKWCSSNCSSSGSRKLW